MNTNIKKFNVDFNPKSDPKLIARQFVEAYGLKAPVDILKFAHELKIAVYKANKLDLPPDKDEGEVWGKTVAFDDKDYDYKAIISEEIPYLNSKRFTLAHEIGHIVLDETFEKDIAYKVKFIYDEKEVKYNIFAINILIPNDLEYKQKRENMSMSDLANFYGVPLTALEIFEKENSFYAS